MTFDAQREERVARTLASCLPELNLAGRALVVGDPSGFAAGALRRAGLEVSPWDRRTTARTWPPSGPFDVVTLRQPASADEFEMNLHAVGARLKPGGSLFVYGANDEGIKSAARRIGELFSNVETVGFRHHGRVWQATVDDDAPAFRGEQADWRAEVKTDDGRYWVSYPGVFAHGRLDDGTALLLDALPNVATDGRVLDYGCGTGIVGMEVLRLHPGARLDLLDIDALSASAARENAPEARVVIGDGWKVLEGRTYDLIVSNPPIHRGKAKDFSMLEAFIADAGSHVARNGRVLFVAQRAAPTVGFLDAVGARFSIVAENTRYRVWEFRNVR